MRSPLLNEIIIPPKSCGNSPDVSIVIPTFSRLELLKRALASCTSDICTAEIVVVDDGSLDGTWEWLSSQHHVLRVRQSNQGQTYAINLGLRVATAPFVRFLDDDDFLEPGIIDRQYKAAVDTGTDIVYSRVDAYLQSTSTRLVQPDLHQWDDFLAVQLGRENGGHFLGMLFRRSILEGVPRRPDFAFREDRMFLLEVGLRDPKVHYVPGCAGYWTRHAGQMQANYRGLKSDAVNWQHLQLYRRILGQLDEDDPRTAARKQAACKVLWPLAHWIAKTRPGDANALVEWIYNLDPAFSPPDPGILGLLYRSLGFKGTERVLRFRRALLGRA